MSAAGLASPGQRLLAWWLDAVVLGVLLLPLNPIVYSSRPSSVLVAALAVPTVLLSLLYLVLCDGGRRGATFGKRMLRIHVADERGGHPIGYRRAMIRRLVYLVGGAAFYIGWIWLLVDKRRQTWHDKVARTVVVRATTERVVESHRGKDDVLAARASEEE